MAHSRRDFLLQTSAAGIAATWATTVRAGERAPIPFAYSLYGMKNLPLLDALDACAKIGYDAVEFALMPTWPAEPSRLSREERRRLRDRLAERRLSVPALMENLPIDGDDAQNRRNLEHLRAASALGRDLAPMQPPLIETILGGSADGWMRLRNQFAERLRTWAEWAATERQMITIKPHRFGAMNLPEHALWLLEQVKSPWIKLAYDYSHYQHRDLTIAQTLKALLPHTRFVHVKDTRLENGRALFTLPGDAGVDYVDLFGLLRQGNYQGCVCVEVSGMLQNRPDYQAVEAARRSYRNLEPAFAKAEIRRR